MSNAQRTLVYLSAFVVGWIGLYYVVSWVTKNGCELHDYRPGNWHDRPWCREVR